MLFASIDIGTNAVRLFFANVFEKKGAASVEKASLIRIQLRLGEDVFSKGFISAHLAAQTGFSEADLELFWEALKSMFDHDHSAARGMMSTRKLIVFKHSTALGSAPAHQLFDAIKIEKIDKSKPARSFDDYSVSIDKSSIPQGVEVIEMV